MGEDTLGWISRSHSLSGARGEDRKLQGQASRVTQIAKSARLVLGQKQLTRSDGFPATPARFPAGSKSERRCVRAPMNTGQRGFRCWEQFHSRSREYGYTSQFHRSPDRMSPSAEPNQSDFLLITRT